MQFDIITIFPKMFSAEGGSASGRDSFGYLNQSMIKRAKAKKLADIRVHDLRKFSRDKHKKVDDRPYGGGPGMVLQIEPLARALDAILKKGRNQKTKIILFSAAGKQFDAKIAADFAKTFDRVIMIAGHYEGVDERIKKLFSAGGRSAFGGKIEEISIGPYVLTGGELPALIVIDAVSRHIPGFLGKQESLEEKRHGVGVPTYTRPEIFTWKGKKYTIPAVLTTGNHKKIDAWRRAHVRHDEAV